MIPLPSETEEQKDSCLESWWHEQHLQTGPALGTGDIWSPWEVPWGQLAFGEQEAPCCSHLSEQACMAGKHKEPSSQRERKAEQGICPAGDLSRATGTRAKPTVPRACRQKAWCLELKAFLRRTGRCDPGEGEGLSKPKRGGENRIRVLWATYIRKLSAVVQSLSWQDTAARRHFVLSLTEQGEHRCSGPRGRLHDTHQSCPVPCLCCSSAA